MNEPSQIRIARLPKGRREVLRGLIPRALMVPLLVASLVSAPPALRGQDAQAYQVLYAASDHYYGLETLCAAFEQVIENRLLRNTVSSAGRLCLRQPDLVSMRFTDPEGDLIVVDGEFAWTFFPSQDDKQVICLVGDGAGGGHNFYENFLADPRGRFEAVHEGREPMGDGMSHKIALEPKEIDGVRSADFRSAVVWFDVDSYLITALDIHDTNEMIRMLRFSDTRVDIDIPDGLFRFEPPAGARVVPPDCLRATPG